MPYVRRCGRGRAGQFAFAVFIVARPFGIAALSVALLARCAGP